MHALARSRTTSASSHNGSDDGRRRTHARAGGMRVGESFAPRDDCDRVRPVEFENGTHVDTFERRVQPFIKVVPRGQLGLVPPLELERWVAAHARYLVEPAV